MSKQLCQSLDGCTVKTNSYISSTVLFGTSTISKVSVVTRGSRGYHERSVVEKNEDVQEVNNCIEANKEEMSWCFLMVLFTKVVLAVVLVLLC